MELKNKSLLEMCAAAEHYYTLKKEVAAKKALLHEQYTGERLQEEVGKLDTQTQLAKMAIGETIENSRQAMLQGAFEKKNSAAEAGKKESLDGDNIPADIRLLELPTVLTGEELQTLFDRHQNNPIFVRALQDYERKHNITEPIDYRSKYDKAIFVIHDVHNCMANNTGDEGWFHVLRDNPRRLQNLDERLTAAISI